VAILNGQLFTGFTIPVPPEEALQQICSRLSMRSELIIENGFEALQFFMFDL
jgi:hypothetical protein